MKNFHSNPRTRVAVGVMVLAAAFATGLTIHAADSPVSPSEGAARMETARKEIATTRSNIVLTIEQLYEIKSAADPRAQFQKFSDQLARMEERGKYTRDLAQTMKRRGDTYFATWEAQIAGIQDPERRRQVEGSRAKRKQSYDRITMFMQQAGKDFTPLLSSLKQIKSLLEGPRSQEKVTAARDQFSVANWRCTDVQRSLMEVEREFEILAADFAGESKSAAPAATDKGAAPK
jgi:hypothetical protein